MVAHEAKLACLLGGEIDHLVAVPSTRRAFADQPLVMLAKRSIRFRDRVLEGLSHVPGTAKRRQECTPGMFHPFRERVRGKRIVLLEDLWVSGGTGLSAAFCLLNADARSVVVCPIAREFNPASDYTPAEYTDESRQPYDVDHWPR